VSGSGAALVAFGALLALMALRVPIGVAMLLVGAGGYAALQGMEPLLALLKTLPLDRFASHSLAVVPLFLLMGEFAARAGLSRDLFAAAGTLAGHRRGGIAMAAIGASAGFAAVCGSSLATAATMGRVALPEMRRHGYSGALATGSLAAGGTLGILIPPSVVLVLYAILTEQNIVALFAAALVPGLLAAAGYVAAIALYVQYRPDAGPARPRAGAGERRAALMRAWPVLAIFLLVIGGLYAGLFTPTEGAAVGAVATAAVAAARGMRLAGLADSLRGAAAITGMVFLILLGAEMFNVFLALTQAPQRAAAAVAASGWSPLLVLAGMLLAYLLLGCVMDSLSMILLTVPTFFPVVMALDFGLTPDETAIWFGILALIVVEVGLITPPVGLNVYVIHGLARDVPLTDTFRGVLPFLAADVVRVALLIAFPGLALWLV